MTTVRVDAYDLLKAVKEGGQKLPRRSTLPILQCVLLEATKAGQVRVTSTDLDEKAVAACEQLVPGLEPTGEGGELAVAVPGKVLKDWLAALGVKPRKVKRGEVLGGEELELAVVTTRWLFGGSRTALVVRAPASKITATFLGLEAAEYPSTDEVPLAEKGKGK